MTNWEDVFSKIEAFHATKRYRFFLRYVWFIQNIPKNLRSFWFYRVQAGWQRAIKGWAVADIVGGADHSTLPALGHQMLWLSENAVGWPAADDYAYDETEDPGGDKSFQRWKDDLRVHGQALVNLADDELQFENITHDEATEALVWVSRYWGSLWH